jgi:chemotaxis protein MotB
MVFIDVCSMKKTSIHFPKFILLLALVFLVSCVPARKYNELVKSEQKASIELEQLKASQLNTSNSLKEFETNYGKLKIDVDQLKKDTLKIGNDFRFLQAQYDIQNVEKEELEKRYDVLRLKGVKETQGFQSDIESRNQELIRKEEALKTLEQELVQKQKQLEEREQRVNELEEIIKRNDESMKKLKAKVTSALKGFENKGLTITEKNGKIYINLEAKLLFASGSTVVESEGKKALIDVSKVLESEKELEIIVEGHTDTDKFTSPNSPKNNWELSVLRATAVVEILTGNSKMNPKLISAAGKGEYVPLDPNDKAKNRRIEIIISPKLTDLFQLINE